MLDLRQKQKYQIGETVLINGKEAVILDAFVYEYDQYCSLFGWVKNRDWKYTCKGMFNAVMTIEEWRIQKLPKPVRITYETIHPVTLEISKGQVEVHPDVLRMFKSDAHYVAHHLSIDINLIEV